MCCKPLKVPVQRLFFALWPEPLLCEQLLLRARPWLRKLDGRVVAQENLHITLAFLGNVDETQQACVEACADAIQIPAFTLSLDRLACWPRPRVAWAGASDAPQGFARLALELQEGARACGLQVDKRRPVAHVTLKRKLAGFGPAEALEPLRWPVERFSLVSSLTRPEGPLYTPLRSWELR